MASVKFMLTLEKHIYRDLQIKSKAAGIKVQELLRVRAIPEFLYGPVTFSNKTIARWQRMGLLKNGKGSRRTK
jgi:hypothetical protein